MHKGPFIGQAVNCSAHKLARMRRHRETQEVRATGRSSSGGMEGVNDVSIAAGNKMADQCPPQKTTTGDMRVGLKLR